MIPACFATLLWSFCVIASRRSIQQLGELSANFWRMVIAVLCLGAVSHAAGIGFESTSFGYLFLSGFIGFGIGDIGFYFALTRIGSRLSILMAQCVAVPVAFLIEWLWLGNLISWRETAAIVVILGGVTLALMRHSDALPGGSGKTFCSGIFFGFIAALGQGGGGVLSRMAYEAQGTIGASGGVIDGILTGASAGYQRLIGGFCCIAVVYAISNGYPRWKNLPGGSRAEDSSAKIFLWVLLAALTGPVVGIVFFQWALISTETAIVQSIVALTPIVIIPLAYWFEGERPRRRSIVGGIIAVCGVVLLALV